MTKREAKRRCLAAMARTLYEDVLAGNAGWPFEWDGEPISEADEERMIAAATELVEEFERRSEPAGSHEAPEASS